MYYLHHEISQLTIQSTQIPSVYDWFLIRQCCNISIQHFVQLLSLYQDLHANGGGDAICAKNITGSMLLQQFLLLLVHINIPVLWVTSIFATRPPEICKNNQHAAAYVGGIQKKSNQ